MKMLILIATAILFIGCGENNNTISSPMVAISIENSIVYDVKIVNEYKEEIVSVFVPEEGKIHCDFYNVDKDIRLINFVCENNLINVNLQKDVVYYFYISDVIYVKFYFDSELGTISYIK